MHTYLIPWPYVRNVGSCRLPRGSLFGAVIITTASRLKGSYRQAQFTLNCFLPIPCPPHPPSPGPNCTGPSRSLIKGWLLQKPSLSGFPFDPLLPRASKPTALAFPAPRLRPIPKQPGPQVPLKQKHRRRAFRHPDRLRPYCCLLLVFDYRGAWPYLFVISTRCQSPGSTLPSAAPRLRLWALCF